MASLDWLLTALQSDDADVAAHALLRLWQHVRHASQKPPACQRPLWEQFAALGARAWRRLGLLLFAEDVLSVKAVVSITVALAVPREGPAGDDAQQAVQQRIWQSDWRQFIVDKLIDCHTRAAAAGTAVTHRGDAEVALRLMMVLRAVFFAALRGGFATPKRQVQTIDLLVELASSPVDSIACVALQVLDALLGDTAEAHRLDKDVCAYLEASRVFADLVVWLHGSLQTPVLAARLAHTPSSQRSHRYRLTLTLLVNAARVSADVVRTIARQLSGQLLDLVLCVTESDLPTQKIGGGSTHELQARAVELLAAVLHHDLPVATDLAGSVRLEGALITIAWLLGHASRPVRVAAYSVLMEVQRLSAARDLARALVEQGCVLICYTLLADEAAENEDVDARTAPCRELLRWVLRMVESEKEAQFLVSLAASARRSTNAKLQRNIILSLLLLSHSSEAVHETVFDGGSLTDIVRDVVYASRDDTHLATALLATALLGSDTQSTLKRDVAASSRFVSVEQAPSPLSQPSCQISLNCQGGERVLVDASSLTTHCKFFARELLRASTPPSSSSTTIDLHNHDAQVVALLVRLLPLSPQHAARELQRIDGDRMLLTQLLWLAKVVECSKCWHAASLAITNSLSSANWRAALELAQELRYPVLLLRALRVALGTEGSTQPAMLNDKMTPSIEASTARDVKDAAMLVWHELLATSHG